MFYILCRKILLLLCDKCESIVSAIGLYRDVWIAAIASSTTSLATRTAAICVRFQGRRVRRGYVTMQITFLTRKSALIYRRGLRQRVASLTINCNGVFAIRAYSADLQMRHQKLRTRRSVCVLPNLVGPTTGETPRARTRAKFVISCSTFSNADHGYKDCALASLFRILPSSNSRSFSLPP